jgi:hypothetical protein
MSGGDMSKVNQADTGKAHEIGRYLLLILCGGALLISAIFPSAGAESDTTKAGQMQAQLASDMTYNNQNAPASTERTKTFPANNGSARYICTPSGFGQNSVCVLRN